VRAYVSNIRLDPRQPKALKKTALRKLLRAAHGQPLGFATVWRSTHFTGQPQANIGNLATSEMAEGRGVGTALVEACAQWAREQGYTLLTLSTGAANTRALRLYHHLGFHDEDVTLTKVL
jgi:ribosomal protein S18 acetylase RimI-like enzyme